MEERLLLHLQTCNCPGHSVLGTDEDKQDPSGYASEPTEPKLCVCTKGKRKVTVIGDPLPCWTGDTYLLTQADVSGGFFACQEPGSVMLQRDCQGLSGSQTITPSCTSTWAPMLLPGVTWSISQVPTELWGRG